MEASSLRLLNELISDIVMMLNFLEMHRLQRFAARLNGLEIYVYINRSFRSIYIYTYTGTEYISLLGEEAEKKREGVYFRY